MNLGEAQMRAGAWEPSVHDHKQDTLLSSEAFCDLLYTYYIAAIEAF